jgi:hypothetical protein
MTLKGNTGMRIIHVLPMLICVPTAIASPMLLASYNRPVEGGLAPALIPEAEFILQLPTGDPPDPDPGLGAGIYWREGGTDTIDFTPQNSPTFPVFAIAATNGTPDDFRFWNLLPPGGGSGSAPMLESTLFGRSPDLVGNTLDYVRLTVRSLQFQHWVPDPDLPDVQGFLYTADLTYEFFGTPVPEPMTAVMLIVAALAASRPKKPQSEWVVLNAPGYPPTSPATAT